MAATQESQRNAITSRNITRNINVVFLLSVFPLPIWPARFSYILFFLFFFPLSFHCSSFSHRFRWDTSTSLTRLSTRAFWFQVIDILLSGGSELLVTTVPGDAVSRLADGIGSFGRLAGGYQKSGHLSILRWLPDPHLQSVHGLRGKRNEWRMKFTMCCTNWRRGMTWREICTPAWKIESKNSATLWLYIIFFVWFIYYTLSGSQFSLQFRECLLWKLCKSNFSFFFLFFLTQ